MEEMGKERRKFPRIKVECIVRYRILDAEQQRLTGKTKDISGGGLCLVANESLQAQTVLAIEMRFPRSPKPAMAVGRVIWSRQSTLGPSAQGKARFDNGVEFVEISDLDRQRIIEQVESKREKSKGASWRTGIARNISK